MKRLNKEDFRFAIVSALGGIVFLLIPNNLALKIDILSAFIFAVFLTVAWRLPLIPQINDKADVINDDIVKSQKELKNLVSNHKVNEVVTYLNTLSPLTKEIGIGVFDNYINRFNLENRGFSVKGEQFALNSFLLFWQKLTIAQRSRKKENGKDIIVRITHSNSIKIWNLKSDNSSYSSITRKLYSAQKEFIANGGIIVRILIGKEELPNQEYRDVIREMENIGIEVKYLHDSVFTVQDYDFLLLFDEKIVLKWNTDSNGKLLSGFAVQDSIDDEVLSDWRALFYTLEEQRNPIKKIPRDREFY